MIESPAQFRMHRAYGRDMDPARGSVMFTETLRLSLLSERGMITTELLTLGDTGITLGRVRSTGHEVALREAETVTFLLPRSGRLDIAIRDRDYRVSSGNFMAFRPTERRTRSTPDATGLFHAATLQIPMARLRELAQRDGTSADTAFALDGAKVQGDTGRFLARTLAQLCQDLFQRPPEFLPAKIVSAIRVMIDDTLSEMMGDAPPTQPSRRTLPAFHRVRQAEEIMHLHSDDPLSMVEVARTLGVSLRSLQLAFNEVYGGLSPRDALNRIRLHKARHRLLAADGADMVTKVALDSGFFHLSRFAQAYARTFGERPSETLARRRA